MKKTVYDYMDLPYTFLTIKQPDGTFFIKVKELEGCMSVGDSIEHAYVMIRDAMIMDIPGSRRTGHDPGARIAIHQGVQREICSTYPDIASQGTRRKSRGG